MALLAKTAPRAGEVTLLDGSCVGPAVDKPKPKDYWGMALRGEDGPPYR